MIRSRLTCFFILALAFLMLWPAGSAFASLMSASSSDADDLNLGSTNSTPAHVPNPEAPKDQELSLWNPIYGLAGSMESSVSSMVTSVTGCNFMTACPFVPRHPGDELFLIDFQFIPDAVPDARDKPPKSPIV